MLPLPGNRESASVQTVSCKKSETAHVCVMSPMSCAPCLAYCVLCCVLCTVLGCALYPQYIGHFILRPVYCALCSVLRRVYCVPYMDCDAASGTVKEKDTYRTAKALVSARETSGKRSAKYCSHSRVTWRGTRSVLVRASTTCTARAVRTTRRW
jgi:hypothetical protein